MSAIPPPARPEREWFLMVQPGGVLSALATVSLVLNQDSVMAQISMCK